MSSANQPPLTRAGVLLATRVIVLGLAGGATTFVGVVAVTQLVRQRGLAWNFQEVSALLAVVSLMSIAASFVVPVVVGRQAVSQLAADAPEEGFFGPFQTQLLVGAALLEGAALCSAVSVLIEGFAGGLIIAGVAVALLLARYAPVETRLDAFIDRGRRQLRDRDQMAKLQR